MLSENTNLVLIRTAGGQEEYYADPVAMKFANGPVLPEQARLLAARSLVEDSSDNLGDEDREDEDDDSNLRSPSR